MEKKVTYPFYYYLAIFLFIILCISFWIFFLKKIDKNLFRPDILSIHNKNYEALQYIVPINPDDLIIDSINNRRIVSNIVNIALKNKNKDIFQFADDLKKEYQDASYEVVYLDSVIGRLQVKLPSTNREQFKEEVKIKMSMDSLLVWDEMIFENFNSPSKLVSNQKDLWYLNDINVNNAWNISLGNSNTIIAVVDNGFDINHPELKNKVVKPYNVVDKNTNVIPSGENHGTHVASIAVGSYDNTNDAYAGICPSCSLMPIKVEDKNGFLSMSYVIDAILYAVKNNADVINLSLGVELPLEINQLSLSQQKGVINSESKDLETFWNDLFLYAKEKNTVCVIAAGNNHILTGIDPFQRSENSIKVGAYSRIANIAKFSNFGDYTTLYAPGENIKGAKNNSQYEYLDGTSMATPIVSGLIGLIKSKNPKYNYDQTINVLLQNTIVENNIKKLKIKTI